MDIDGIDFTNCGGLWIADIYTSFGHHEVLLVGEKDAPDPDQVKAFVKFKQNINNNLKDVKNKLRFGFLYRPIRIALNNENRVGVQFKNKLTGKQVGMIFWG